MFVTLVLGWAQAKFDNPMVDPEKARQAREEWEFQMEDPLPWQPERRTTQSLQAERDSFFALDQLQE